MKELTIRKADDMHVHLRQNEMLRNVLGYTALQCGRALIMPNTTPPILTVQDLVNYRETIVSELGDRTDFTPLMTFKVVPATSAAIVQDMKKAGATAGKLYPDGVTTNSEGGVTDFEALYPAYEAMEKEGIVLCLHGEMPGAFSMDRESAFLDTLRTIASDFPKLKIVLEHATTADAIACVLSLPHNVAATLTVHHLFITLDDVIGDKLNPHVFCKPIAKRPEDRDALVKAALSGNPKFFLGSDSAPHLISNKENACGAAGVYTAPVLLPALCELFAKHDKLNLLELFTSVYGAKFYGLPLNESSITLIEESWTVPEEFQSVKPFLAGSKLSWRVHPDAGKSKTKTTASAKVL
jgi:dihydroorotase